MSPLAQAIERSPARTAPVPRQPVGSQRLRGADTTRLRLVVPDIARRRVPFSIVCIALLLLGILGVLLVNISISHSTYQVERLTAEQKALHEERARLSEDISYRESPQNIASAAEAMGLRRSLDPQYLLLSTGDILSPGSVTGSDVRNSETVPGPRADARDDVRPNLRSDERLPAVGGDSRQMQAPSQRRPG